MTPVVAQAAARPFTFLSCWPRILGAVRLRTMITLLLITAALVACGALAAGGPITLGGGRERVPPRAVTVPFASLATLSGLVVPAAAASAFISGRVLLAVPLQETLREDT